MQRIGSLARSVLVITVAVAVKMASVYADIVVGSGGYSTVQDAINNNTGGTIIITESPHFESGFTVTNPFSIRSGLSGARVEFGITSGSIIIDSDNCTIDNINFYQHTTAPAIEFNASTYRPTIRNCAVVAVSNDVTWLGIIDWGSNVPIISEVTFLNQAFGIYSKGDGTYLQFCWMVNSLGNLHWDGYFSQGGNYSTETTYFEVTNSSAQQNVNITALGGEQLGFNSIGAWYENDGTLSNGSNINFNNRYVSLYELTFKNNYFKVCPQRAFFGDNNLSTPYCSECDADDVKDILRPLNSFSDDCPNF